MLLYALALLVRWQPAFLHPTEPPLDPSWMMTLAHAFTNHLRFGTDLIFTFGPYGFLFSPYYDARTYPLLVATQSLWTITFVIAAWRFARRRMDSPIVAVAWMIPIVAMVAMAPENFFFACAALLIAECFDADARRERVSKTIWPLIVVLALAAWTKFTFFVAGPAVVGAVGVSAILRRDPRRAAAIALAYVLALVSLWLAAAQPLGGIVAYVRGAIELTRGYSAAMTTKGPESDVLLFMTGALLMVVAFADDQWQSRGWRGAILAIVALASVFALIFKTGFVLHDDLHAMIAGPTLLVITLIVGAMLWRRSRGCAPRRVVCLMLLIAPATDVWYGFIIHSGETATNYFVRTVQTAQDSFAAIGRSISGRSDFAAQASASREDIRREHPVPASIRGTVDIYPFHQSVVFADDLDYHPRPVFQSYAAYTPALAALNVEHLNGPSAPETILFNVQTILDRLPALDEGLSWPVLLSRYDIDDDQTQEFLWLRRRAEPRAVEFSSALPYTARLNEHFEIPGGGPEMIWATIDVRGTWRSHVRELAYKPKPLWIRVRTANGHEQNYQFVPAIARTGFLLSPLILNRADFARLASDERRSGIRAKIVESILISSDPDADAYYAPDVSVRLSRMTIGR